MKRFAKRPVLISRSFILPLPAGEGRGEGMLLPLLLLLVLLAGCATGGQAKKAPVPPPVAAAAKPAAPVAPAAPSVVRLTGAKEGFVISEPSDLDAQVRGEFEKGTALLKEGDYQKSAELLEKVIEAAPRLTSPRINAAKAYLGLKKPEIAERHLKAALEAIPGHPVASNEYALLLRKAGRFAEARAVYEKALKVFPEYHPVEKNLAILCDLYLKDYACARTHYENYSKALPQDRQVKLWIAGLPARSGHLAMQTEAGR